jgi:membrane-bound lytic murein transglycosylase D
LNYLKIVLYSIPFFVFINLNASNPPNISPHEYIKNIHFCNEILPLEKPHVARQLRLAMRRLSRGMGYSIRTRASYCFSIIEPILRRNNIPLDFKYLCVIESGLVPNATSHKGAHGYWQFMPATARAMGLKIDGKIDERRDLSKSTQAACKYLKELYQKFGSWTVVAAAYNAGPGGASAYQRRGSENYYNWRAKAETRQYVYRVVAAKEWLKNPEQMTMIAMALSDPKNYVIENKPPLPTPKTTKPVYDFSRPALIVSVPDTQKIELPKIADKAPEVREPLYDLDRTLHTTTLESGSLQKGQTWTFIAKTDKRFSEMNIYKNDRIYATVERYDRASKNLILRATQVYSPQRNQITQINFVNVEANQLGTDLSKEDKKIFYWKKL